VNNAIYDQLGERWYTAQDDPVALLRAESRLHNPWVRDRIRQVFNGRRCTVLDIGCGAGFLSNAVAEDGHQVTGLDASADSLAVAARHDRTQRVRYHSGDALALPYRDRSFDVVCAMDFLEHVETPAAVVAEVARVLAPGGLFFFHTFHRGWLSWLFVIKGVEWFVRNTPRDMHVLRLFIKPCELDGLCRAHGLERIELRGTRPLFDAAMWRMLRTGVVPEGFGFTFTSSTRLSYCGIACKRYWDARRIPPGKELR
jgi:2-polyprenyl-6-hydroxyphenyl methylase/3-demethylubiquinone-9 3-methyltransferase